jgi:outer membrane protein assembly factor BamB/tetratricopeptide (TPR) repeat protein
LFSIVVDKYLATSYGGKALQFLGDAALDRGNYLEALEYFKTIVAFIPDKEMQTPELKLKIKFCEKALGQLSEVDTEEGKSKLTEKEIQLLKTAIQKEIPNKKNVTNQRSSGDYISGDDYTSFKPTLDPLGLLPSEWENDLLSSRDDFFVYGQPVITDTSIVVRLKNIIYCYSILNGNLRWKNDMGGKAVWQDWGQRQYPLEDVVIQDGIVVAPIFKGGSSLVALDEITGQLKWAYGPMASTDNDLSLMRFECSPAAGPGTIYANYVLDNIKGDTHIDTEYGVIAIESSTGRLKWRRQVCRLQPGKFDGGFGTARKSRIRSFFTPPLYHEGTVYVSTNAGAVSAMDGLSGRIKWLMRYPYYPSVHDLTIQFGRLYHFRNGVPLMQPHTPMFWLNQRPLIVGENLYVMPINSPFMLCVDRGSGKINWTFDKPTAGFNYFLGPISTGELVITGNGRKVRSLGSLGETNLRDPLYLVDPKTGSITWKSPDIILFDEQPVMNCGINPASAAKQYGGANINIRYFETNARPFLMEGDRIILSGWADQSWRYPKEKSYMAPVEIDFWQYRPGMYVFAMSELDLLNKKILNQRRYYADPILVNAEQIINDKTNRNHWNMPMGAPLTLEDLSKIPRRTKEQDDQMAALEKVIADHVPVNEYPAFMPFSRVTFSRFGVPFELRLSPRKISMVYDRGAFEAMIKPDESLLALFSKSEICVKDGDYLKASEYLKQCMQMVSPEDINFRALIKQQFYKVYLELTRASIRAHKPQKQMEYTLGMSNTASVLPEEIEALFALAEAYGNNNLMLKASSCLRTLIEVYGHHEYPISTLAAKACYFQEDSAQIQNTFSEIFKEAKSNVGVIYQKEAEKALDLTNNSFPLFYSSVSPLPKELIVRTGDLAILKLIELLKKDKGLEAEYSKVGEAELGNDQVNQLFFHVWKYPNTSMGQTAFDKIFLLSKNLEVEEKRDLWRKMGHLSKICKFKLPDELSVFLLSPSRAEPKPVNLTFGDKIYEIPNFKDGVMITLKRNGDLSAYANYLFIGVRVPKKIGFRFCVVCFDLSLGKEVWRTEEFRLKDLGKEPGFYEATVFQDIVVVNGLYDVFGFQIKDGLPLWHYKTPNNFEICDSTVSGNIFVLSGFSETIALQIETKSPIGEVAWQQKEDGDIYHKPFFYEDKFISVRKYPFSIISRHRSTGSLLGRLLVPDLSLNVDHPFLKDGHKELPVGIFNQYVAVSDEKYLLLYDVNKMELVWKTLISNVDFSNTLKLRISINDKYIVLIKQDYDRKAIYCYDKKTGEIIWNTDPNNSESPQPIYSLLLENDILYGIGEHPGQGFFIVAYDCVKGELKYKNLIDGYSTVPLVKLLENVFDNQIIAVIQDRKDFQIVIMNKSTGIVEKRVSGKGDGPIGEVGRVAVIIQDSHPVLFSKLQFNY